MTSIRIAIIALILSTTLVACNKNLFTNGQNEMVLLEKEIAAHGKIDTYDTANWEIPRSGIDSLNTSETHLINAYLNAFIPEYPDTVSYAIIHYYPGKDNCNSTGLATRDDIGKETKKLNKAIKKRKYLTQLSLYKNNKGIERWNKHKEWHSDQNMTISNRFFKYHFPCSSYLIIHKSGKYYYYYGPSWLEKKLWDADTFMKCIDKGYI